MRRFLIGWILVVLLLPFAAAWFYHEWDEKNSRIEQEISSLQIEIQGDGEYRLGVTDYLTGAVAAQIPADFEMETLKAQAVLARTCLYKRSGSKMLMDASDIGLTWLDESERKQLWGISYQENNTKIHQAVQETDGQILYYGGQMILPAWFFVGNGMTRSSKEALGEDIPWLQQVESKWDPESENYQTEVAMTKKQMIRLLKQDCPDFVCTPDSLAMNCEITSVDSAGYVLELQVGNQMISGEEFRYALNLPSACFKIAFEGKQVRLTVYGQGNGLGFDQYGANSQAKEGKNYEQLLEYYLTGVKVGE